MSISQGRLSTSQFLWAAFPPQWLANRHVSLSEGLGFGRQHSKTYKGPNLQKSRVHESVLVGYFCQAVGWVGRDLDVQRHPHDTPQQRMLRAINLSHNPLDPAIGDMIVQLDNSGELPKEFYIFEFKVNWKKGLSDEHSKFRVKNKGQNLTQQATAKILGQFPEAQRAHFYGALVGTKGKHKTLGVVPYWDALLEQHSTKVPSALEMLLKIAVDSSSGGMTLERLTEYVEMINNSAAEGSMASTGSARFAVAYDDYQLYSFNLDTLMEYQMEKNRVLENLRRLEGENEREIDPGHSLGM